MCTLTSNIKLLIFVLENVQLTRSVKLMSDADSVHINTKHQTNDCVRKCRH